jgi:hypothetical protein
VGHGFPALPRVRPGSAGMMKQVRFNVLESALVLVVHNGAPDVTFAVRSQTSQR